MAMLKIHWLHVVLATKSRLLCSIMIKIHVVMATWSRPLHNNNKDSCVTDCLVNACLHFYGDNDNEKDKTIYGKDSLAPYGTGQLVNASLHNYGKGFW